MKKIKLYNLIFPGYLLWLLPPVWIIIAPANFIIDSIVLLLTLVFLKLSPKIYKQTILKIWGLGFLADFVGSVFLLIISQTFYSIYAAGTLFSKEIRNLFNNIRLAIEYNPFYEMAALICILLAIALSGICIYHFNLKISLKKIDIAIHHKKCIALALSIFTAPYMLLIPAELFM